MLLVEDEFHTTQETLQYLRIRGASVVGPVPTVDYALEIIHTERVLDAVIVDTELRGIDSFAVADALMVRNISFVFVTAGDGAGIPALYRHVTCWRKPVELDDMGECLFAIPRPSRRRGTNFSRSGARTQ